MAMKRRVYTPEFRAMLGWKTSWFDMQEKLGVIPRGRQDAGSRRRWWTVEEANAVFDRLTAEADARRAAEAAPPTSARRPRREPQAPTQKARGR